MWLSGQETVSDKASGYTVKPCAVLHLSLQSQNAKKKASANTFPDYQQNDKMPLEIRNDGETFLSMKNKSLHMRECFWSSIEQGK